MAARYLHIILIGISFTIVLLHNFIPHHHDSSDSGAKCIYTNEQAETSFFTLIIQRIKAVDLGENHLQQLVVSEEDPQGSFDHFQLISIPDFLGECDDEKSILNPQERASVFIITPQSKQLQESTFFRGPPLT